MTTAFEDTLRIAEQHSSLGSSDALGEVLRATGAIRLTLAIGSGWRVLRAEGAEELFGDEVGFDLPLADADRTRLHAALGLVADRAPVSELRTEFRLLDRDGQPYWFDAYIWPRVDPKTCSLVLEAFLWDITPLKRSDELRRLTLKVIDLISCDGPIEELLLPVTERIQESARFDGVALILLRDAMNLPLSAGAEGFVGLDLAHCALARRVAQVDDDRPNLCTQCPYAGGRGGFSAGLRSRGGSFYSNDLPDTGCALHGTTIKNPDAPIFQSVALVPLRASGVVVGLLQLGRQERKSFDSPVIEYFEGLGFNIGMAIEKAEQTRRLRSAVARYGALFETTHDGILLRTINGQVEAANHAFLQMVGRDIEQLRELPPWKYLRNSNAGGAQVCHPGALLLEGHSPDREMRLVDQNGARVSVMSRSWIVSDEDGVPQRQLQVFRDISREKAAEEDRRRLVTAIEQSAEVVLITDTEGLIEYANPSFEKATGYRVSEALQRALRSLLAESQANARFDELWDLVTNGEVGSGRFLHQRKDGSTYQVDTTISPVRDEIGRITHFVALQRDITEMIELELQLLQAQKLESIGLLAAGIAHEINTPSQYVGDNVAFLKESFGNLRQVIDATLELRDAVGDCQDFAEQVAHVDETVRANDLLFLSAEIPSALDQSLEGLQRIGQIVGAMKFFSHPGANTIEPVDLHRAIESTVTVARNEWKYVAELKLEFGEDMPDVPCVPNEINQVVLNLIINAAHAIQDTQREDGALGRITIRTHVDGEHAVIEIEDTGTGIEESNRPRVFDPFFTTKDVGRGTGQGLSLSRDVVVNRHGGTLSFRTEIGVGTTFVVRLPLKQEIGRKRR